MTCGLGIDTMALAEHFERVVSIERDEVLAEVVRYNMSLLGIQNVEVVTASSEEYVASTSGLELMDHPHLAWHLSGGTTELLLVEPENKNVRCKRIGGTTDISAGQLIDRTGHLLKLPFPAGKHLDALSEQATARDFFSVKCEGMGFSLSGVQNKVQQYFENCQDTAETAAYALRCICSAVLRASENAQKSYPDLPIVFSGGVSSNAMLRKAVSPLNPIFAAPQYSTDNAMGVAVLTFRMREE